MPLFERQLRMTVHYEARCELVLALQAPNPVQFFEAPEDRDPTSIVRTHLENTKELWLAEQSSLRKSSTFYVEGKFGRSAQLRHDETIFQTIYLLLQAGGPPCVMKSAFNHSLPRYFSSF